MATYSSIKYNFTPPAATTSAQVGAGAMTLITSVDASSDSTISFVDGASSVVLDNTYKTYIFKFINIHPSAHAVFSFNGSTDAGSNYNVTKTSSATSAYHPEGGGGASYYYIESGDLAQSTGFQFLSGAVYTDNDANMGGILYIFNPSDTTFVTHFLADTQRMDYAGGQGYTNRWLLAGYFNTTSAVDAIQFKMNSGNIDAGTIKLYGIA